jgi:hypothetical protein
MSLRHRHRIGHVARIHFHRHRTAFPVSQQAVSDDAGTAPSVLVVSDLRQWAGVALVHAVTGVVQRKTAFRQVPVSQLLLDPRLRGQKPIQRRVQLVRISVLDAKLGTQRARCPRPHSPKLRRRRQHPLGNHPKNQIALTALPGRKKLGNAKLLHHPKHCTDVAARKGAYGLGYISRRNHVFAGQRQLEYCQDFVRKHR